MGDGESARLWLRKKVFVVRALLKTAKSFNVVKRWTREGNSSYVGMGGRESRSSCLFSTSYLH